MDESLDFWAANTIIIDMKAHFREFPPGSIWTSLQVRESLWCLDLEIKTDETDSKE